MDKDTQLTDLQKQLLRIEGEIAALRIIIAYTEAQKIRNIPKIQTVIDDYRSVLVESVQELALSSVQTGNKGLEIFSKSAEQIANKYVDSVERMVGILNAKSS